MSLRIKLRPRLKMGELSAGANNMAVRALGLTGRFVLMLYLAKFTDFATIGVFGLIAAVASIAPAVLSLGLHYQMYRNLVGATPLEVGHRLRDRWILHCALCAPIATLGAATLTAIPYSPPISFGLVSFAALISFMEVLLNEPHLLLISAHRPILANVIYFCRSAIWIFPFVAISFFAPQFRSLHSLLGAWLAGQVVGVILFFVALRRWPWLSIAAAPFQPAWILRDFGKSMLIYLSDLGLIAAAFGDRFIIGAFLDIRAVGIYVFLWNIAIGFQQLVFTALVQVAFPKLVEAARSGGAALRDKLWAELRAVLATCLPLAATIYALAPILDLAVRRRTFHDHAGILLSLLIAMTIRLLADVLNYGLYAREKDNWLAAINILAAPAASGLAALCLFAFGLPGVGYAATVTSILLLSSRAWVLRGELM